MFCVLRLFYHIIALAIHLWGCSYFTDDFIYEKLKFRKMNHLSAVTELRGVEFRTKSEVHLALKAMPLTPQCSASWNLTESMVPNQTMGPPTSRLGVPTLVKATKTIPHRQAHQPTWSKQSITETHWQWKLCITSLSPRDLILVQCPFYFQLWLNNHQFTDVPPSWEISDALQLPFFFF